MVMHAARAWRADPAPQDAARPLTLLELVAAVADSARSDDEVVATVAHLINTGAVTLVGNFRGAHVRVS